MGIYVPNLEKPDDCRVCPFLRYEVDCGRSSCIVTSRILAERYRTIPFDGVPDWCPLVYLNTPLTRGFDKQAEKKNETLHGC